MCKLNGYIWHQNERRPFQSLKGFSISLEHKSSGARALGTQLVGQLDSRKTWFSNVLPGTRILVILMTFPMTSIKWIILGRFTKKPRDFFGFLEKILSSQLYWLCNNNLINLWQLIDVTSNIVLLQPCHVSIVFHCILFYFIVLYCIVLYFIVFYSIFIVFLLYFILLYFIVFHCISLYFIVFYCVLLYFLVALACCLCQQ